MSWCTVAAMGRRPAVGVLSAGRVGASAVGRAYANGMKVPMPAVTIDYDPKQQYSIEEMKSMLRRVGMQTGGSKSVLAGRLQAWRLSRQAFEKGDTVGKLDSTSVSSSDALLSEALPPGALSSSFPSEGSSRGRPGSSTATEVSPDGSIGGRLSRWSSRTVARPPTATAPPTSPSESSSSPPPSSPSPTAMVDRLDELRHEAIGGDFGRTGNRAPGHQALRDRIYTLVTEIRNAQDAVSLSRQFAELLQVSLQLNALRGRIDFPKSHFLYFALQRACALGQLEMAFAMLLQIKLLSPQAYVRIVDVLAFEALLEGCWKRGAVDYFVGLLERMRIEGVPMQKRTFEIAFEGLIEYNQVEALQVHWTIYRSQVREYSQLAVHPRLERRVTQMLQGILPPIRPPVRRHFSQQKNE